jgi:hypothetical protein
MGGLADRTGRSPLRVFSHVKITHPRHAYFGLTGTIVRIDSSRRRVWVSLPGGDVVPAGHRSVEVIVPRPARSVE